MEIDKLGRISLIFSVVLLISSINEAYRPGDIVPMSKMGHYHSSRTAWHDMIGRHCPIFAVNRGVLIPIPMPVGYTGADPYKIDTQEMICWVSQLKWWICQHTMWKFIRTYISSSGIPNTGQNTFLSDIHALHSCDGSCGHMPNVNAHVFYRIMPDFVPVWFGISREERSEIDVTSGLFVLFGSGLLLSVILSIYILQSSKDKISKFVRENVGESNAPGMGVEKVE